MNYLVCVLEIFFDSVSCCLEKFTNKHYKGDLSPIKLSHTPVVYYQRPNKALSNKRQEK